MTEGTADDSASELVKDLELTLRETSICGLGQFAPAPVTSMLKYLPDEVNAHLRDAAAQPVPVRCGQRPGSEVPRE